MMVETILESSQDFGMSGGALPQWKRELLQRRAARSRPPAPPAPPPPPPPPAPQDEDEELRYGPGIVKRLKSRYLSLALRDAPRRRPSVLRRAASLEHLLEQRPPLPPAPRPAARAPRPASLVAHPHPHSRESVKRARSVDALSRLESRDDPPPSPPPPPPAPAPPPPPPRPSARPPRRPTPLLRETERPPPDLVRSTLRKFEPAPVRRAAPAARVSAALRGLERAATTPEPRSPSPPTTPAPADARPADEPEATSTPRPVSRAALEGIARAGSTTRYAFEAPQRASHLPPLAATNPVLVGRARRVGVIRPMPAQTSPPLPSPPAEPRDEKPGDESRHIADATPRIIEDSPGALSPVPGEPEKRELPPAALVEPTPRPPPDEPPPPAPEPPAPDAEPATKPEMSPKPKMQKMINGYADPPRATRDPVSPVERAWNGVTLKKTPPAEPKPTESVTGAPRRPAGVRGAGRGSVAPPSVVFNFSHRKDVPDYIENDGLILRASRRDRFKAGEPGVVVLRPELLSRSDSDSEGESEGVDGPPSPCAVRFVNDNVLINGRSSMPGAKDQLRAARLKLQFDDSLTRTFEYPSETSLCEDLDETAAPTAPATPLATPAAAPLAAAPAAATLAANTHLVSGALGRYTPSKTCADAFQLGVTRHAPPAPAPASHHENGTNGHEKSETGAGEAGGASETGEEAGDARPCGADAARSWSDARTLATDLLF